ncbi:MAG: hypothetical protein NTZ93_00065 [Candidatus Beckwithbacteria bacterium]|nr:hypothetical protein [Candidatus Beckwithbacteria bacterium]
MESSSYKLKFPNLNMTSGSKSSTNYNILDTVGQNAPGEYASTGFYVKAGFPYIKTIIPFNFTISKLSINFGTLIPNVFPSPPPTNTLTVSFGGAGGYCVNAYENHPLQLKSTPTNIPDTLCNSSCSETTADDWDDPTKYGFGYHMSGNDVPAEFTGPAPLFKQFFKQFSDASSGEIPEIVMSSPNVGKSRVATVTYQASIGASQAAGDYTNSIIFTAIPTY